MDEFDRAASQVAGSFDAAAAGVVASERQTYRPSLYSALMADPDVAARANRLGRRTGIPGDVVERNMPEVQRNTSLDDYDRAVLNSPSLQKWLADQRNAASSHDDIGVLAGIERTIRDWGSGRRRPANVPRVMSGVEYGQQVRRAMADNPALDADAARSIVASGNTVTNEQIAGESRGPAPSAASVLAGMFDPARFRSASAGMSVAAADALGMDPTQALREYERQRFRSSLADPEFETATGRGLYSGGVSLVQNSPGILLSILSGNPAPGLLLAGGGVTAEGYGKYRARGATPGQAAAGAVGEGAVELATEALPMGFLVKRLGKAGMGEFVTGLLAREIPGEQVATFVQDAIDTAVANPGKTWGDFWNERLGAQYETLLATIGMTGAMGAVHAAGRRFTREDGAAQEAERATAVAQTLLDLSAASKLRERDPEAFRQLVEDMAEGAEVYADAQVLANTLNQSAITLEELRAVAPQTAAQLEAAMQNPGADIAIPVAELMAAGPDIAAPLIDHIRETPDAMSRAEAQEYLKTEGETIRADVERVVVQEMGRAEQQRGADMVRDQFEQKLNEAGRFRPEVNRAYATMLGHFYATQAERAGVPIEDFLQRYGLAVATEAKQGAQVVEQPDRNEPLISLRKRESVLNSLLECLA